MYNKGLFFATLFMLSACTQSLNKTAQVEQLENAVTEEIAIEEAGRMDADNEDMMVLDEVSAPARSVESTVGTTAGVTNKKEKSDKSKVTTWKRSEKIENSCVLEVGHEDRIPLKGMQFAVQVDEFRARVVMDAYYYNDRDRQLEGTFKLRLPNGASPYYFAFGETVLLDKEKDAVQFASYDKEDFNFDPDDILSFREKEWSNPKEARMVPKEKAAFAYNQTVRRRVDPALMEWAGADIFNCRVFPLQAKKLHRIVIAYDVNLTELENGRIFNLQIPQEECPIVLDINASNAKGNVRISKQEKDGREFKHNKRLYYHVDSPKEKEIRIAYTNKQNTLLQGDDYFASQFKLDLPSSTQSVASKAVFALDMSLSSSPDKFNVWTKLLLATLANNEKELQEFALLGFNVESFWWKPKYIKNTAANRKALEEYINGLSLEGATDLAQALSQIKTAKWTRGVNQIFLLSDASISWGEKDAQRIKTLVETGDKVFAYQTGMSGTNRPLLELLTRSSGGALYAVANETELAKASTAFKNSSWKIESIKMQGGEDLLVAGRPAFLYDEQQVIVAGRGKGQGDLLLNLSQGAQKKQFKIKFPSTQSSTLTQRCYGQIAVEQLEEFGSFSEDYSKSYSVHFRVPGKTCALLMLESEEDYQSYNIKPEEEAFVVKSSKVNTVVAKIIKESSALLANPKLAFTNWLSKLEKMPGVEFEQSTAMKLLLDQLPESAFDIASSQLVCKDRKTLTADYKKALAEKELAYASVEKEALNRSKSSAADALKCWSSLLERSPSNQVLARDIAYNAIANRQYVPAYYLLKNVLTSRPYEPQTYHGLAQLLRKMGKNDLALLYFEIALGAKWNSRFGDFKEIVRMDYMQFLQEVTTGKVKLTNSFFAKDRMTTLQSTDKNKEAKMAVFMEWNTDQTDIDLHVVEPSGEECFYRHKTTATGGRITQDVTQGYGPEMFIHTNPPKGKYQVKTKYYSSNQSRSSTPTKVIVRLVENIGTTKQKITTKVIKLKDSKDLQTVFEFEQ